jgi:hypothetical protein
MTRPDDPNEGWPFQRQKEALLIAVARLEELGEAETLERIEAVLEGKK